MTMSKYLNKLTRKKEQKREFNKNTVHFQREETKIYTNKVLIRE
jgi:hypothetical protein